jgi:hypothetical protein
MSQAGDSQQNPQDGQASDRPRNAEDGPPQTDRTPEGAAPDRQIAQEPQQSTGLGSGQS